MFAAEDKTQFPGEGRSGQMILLGWKSRGHSYGWAWLPYHFGFGEMTYVIIIIIVAILYLTWGRR